MVADQGKRESAELRRLREQNAEAEERWRRRFTVSDPTAAIREKLASAEAAALRLRLTVMGGPVERRPEARPPAEEPAARTQPEPAPPSPANLRFAPSPSRPGRKPGTRAYSDEQCDEYARRALEMRSTPPPAQWREIEEQLMIPEKTLRRYIKALREKEGH
jgi:hypothetical protein